MYESAKLYIAVHPDQHYADANHLEKIDLSSTGEEIVEQFNQLFPRSGQPLAVLKMFYVRISDPEPVAWRGNFVRGCARFTI